MSGITLSEEPKKEVEERITVKDDKPLTDYLTNFSSNNENKYGLSMFSKDKPGENPQGILSALLKIQQELKTPKAQFNAFGKYKYRNAEDILESVKPLLKANGCVLTISDEVVMVGNRFYVKAEVTIRDSKTGDAYSVTALAREEESKKGMDSSQISGAASSYARKYALNGLFAIDDTKDSDTTNLHGK